MKRPRITIGEYEKSKLPKRIDQIKSSIQRIIDGKTINLSSISSSAFDLFSLSQVSHHGTMEEKAFLLKLSFDTKLLWFIQTGIPEGSTQEIQFYDHKVTLPGSSSLTYNGIPSYTEWLLMGLILRRYEVITKTLSNPPNDIEAPPESKDRWNLTEFVYYKALIEKRSNRPAIYQSALEVAKDPGSIRFLLGGNYEVLPTTPERKAWVDHMYLPFLKLFELAANEEGTTFNEELACVLKTYVKFIEDNDLSYDRKHWLPIRLLAACAYAHDQGIIITVESDYLPKWLIEGEFGAN